jgi:hypothetical protein
MVLVAPPAPTLPPELERPSEQVDWPSDGGSGGGWGGHDGGSGGGGGWWNEEPDEWETDADTPYQHSRTRRVLSLFTVLVLALASVGGFLLLLMGSGSGAVLSARVLSVESVGSGQAPSARVNFQVTNTARQSSGARCLLSVFSGVTELGSTTVFAEEPIDVGITQHATVLVTLDRAATALSATVTCQQASVVTAK